MRNAVLDSQELPGAPAYGEEPRRGRSRTVYQALLRERAGDPGHLDPFVASASRAFLKERLAAAASLAVDVPDDIRALPAWLEAGVAEVKRAYREYLAERRAGAPRRYFRNRSHALHVLRAIAPTKLVDGAWLYGLLPRWREPAVHGLVRTFLEELGDGDPAQNHVVVYRRLLQAQGCEGTAGLADEHYTQGAIQLALGHHAAEFLPEIVGFNLGYEQLPLHLLVTAAELAELGIDPYYFTVHVTVDNASTGHARKALAAVHELAPRLVDPSEFHRRVIDGIRLNWLGRGTVDVVESFDLESELVAVLSRKAVAGAGLHADRCRIGGRTVNEWLAEPAGMRDFLRALEKAGWVQRGRDRRESRFWSLLQGGHAPMFGVFDGYEQQLLADWIEGEGGATERPRRFRPGDAETLPPAPLAAPRGGSVRDVVEHHLAPLEPAGIDADVASLAETLRRSADDVDETMTTLIGLISPANHPTPAGLLATRIFSDLHARLR